MALVTVLLCTHNPHPERLSRTLAALEYQTLPKANWELLVIDNASATPLPALLIEWHPQGRMLREKRLGLTFARQHGIAAATSDLLLFCDDDNVLAPDYLDTALSLFSSSPWLGAAGGKIKADYAAPVPEWFVPFTGHLAVRDLGPLRLLGEWDSAESRCYFPFSPLGAGLVLRRSIARHYAASLGSNPVITDRKGRSLSSGGDNALVLTALEEGWQVGYFPELALTHLIAADRLRPEYLARLNRAGSESWVRLLAEHGIFPWEPIRGWTVPLRQARAYLSLRAWRDPAAYFRWAGACGLFEGRARIARA